MQRAKEFIEILSEGLKALSKKGINEISYGKNYLTFWGIGNMKHVRKILLLVLEGTEIELLELRENDAIFRFKQIH